VADFSLSHLQFATRWNRTAWWIPRSLFFSLYEGIPSMGAGGLPPVILRCVLMANGKELCYCCVGFWRTAPKCLPPILWGVLLDVGHSVVLMVLLSGVLWSLDTVPTAAYILSSFSDGMSHAIKFIARRVGLMSW